MNLYLISRTEVDWYDTYSEAVVAADDADEAKTIHPRGGEARIPAHRHDEGTWTDDPSKVTAVLIGEAVAGTNVGVICASFHAG